MAESATTIQTILSYAWIIFQVAAGLGFVIFVHELGHFLVAKACGVKCEKFYIGFDVGGRKIWHRQWGETEYGIGVVPLGGYVKMLGQDDNPSNIAEENERSKIKKDGSDPEAASETNSDTSSKSLAPKKETQAEPKEIDPRSYMAKSVPQRMAIISAGVIMNLIFGFLFAVVAFRLGVKQTPAIVNDVVAGSPAWKADLRPGFALTHIGEKTDLSFRDIIMGVALFDKEDGLKVTVKRPGTDDSKKFNLQPKITEGRLVPSVGIIGPSTLEISPPAAGTFLANHQVDLQEGDRITAIQGNPIKSFDECTSYLATHRDEEVVLTILRKNPAQKENIPSTETDSDSDESLEVTLPPRPIRRLGLIMAMAPVVAVQQGSPAEKAGIQEGDLLVELNGEPLGDPETLPQRALKAGQTNGEIKLTFLRNPTKQSENKTEQGENKEPNGKENQERITKTLTYRAPYSLEPIIAPGDPFVLPGLGLAYTTTNQVERVIPDSPAAKAGIAKGDRVTSVQFLLEKETEKPNKQAKAWSKLEAMSLDASHPNWPYLANAINRIPSGLQVKITLESGEKPKTLELSTYESEQWHMASRGNLTQSLRITRVADTWGEAVRLGKRELWYSVTMVYRFLQKIGHQISPKALGGPLTIAQAAGQSASNGLGNLLVFLTMLSANLAVINFLPIPVLDGGHMVFLAWEGIFRKPMSERIVIAFHMLGFAMIISLMLFVIGLDIGRLFGLT